MIFAALLTSGNAGIEQMPTDNRAKAYGVEGGLRVIRNLDLEPSWSLKQAKEPGFMRSLITWVGGSKGYINSNPDHSVISERCAVGLMRMPIGNRQPGVHVHSVTEIYIILKGQVESFDGVGNTHRAGPLDCIYIPAGVPHGVRAIGDEDLQLVWIHDAIEKEGVSIYLDGSGPFPAAAEVSLIAFRALEPDWSAPRAAEAGHLRYAVNWVGGSDGFVNHNPSHAAINERICVGLTVIMPGNKQALHSHRDPEIYVVLRGAGMIRHENDLVEVAPLDAIYFNAGELHGLRNHTDEPLYVMWVHEAAQRIDAARGKE